MTNAEHSATPSFQFYVVNIHEFQAKQLLKQHGVAVPDGTVCSTAEEAEALLTEAKIATIAGTPFGAKDCIRLSFASSMDTLQRAMENLRAFISK